MNIKMLESRIIKLKKRQVKLLKNPNYCKGVLYEELNSKILECDYWIKKIKNERIKSQNKNTIILNTIDESEEIIIGTIIKRL